MKIEVKIAKKEIKRNIKREIYTIISIILCTILITTFTTVITSVKKGIDESFAKENNNYHLMIKNINIEDLNKIKSEDFVDKIYIKDDKDESLKELVNENIDNNTNIYIKYKNIKKVCNYTTKIIKDVNLLEDEQIDINDKFVFNQRLLTINGIIDIEIDENNNIPICISRVNYSYAIDLLQIVAIVIFSVLFIIILYNSFLITINERKKEYAILNSVGCTEGQVLKITFIETVLISIVGILIGFLGAIGCSNIVLKMLNNILINTGYSFNIIIDIKNISILFLILFINIFIAALIPSVKACTSSVMNEMKNLNDIKYKKMNTLSEKIFPIELKMAIKNIKRNKSKYIIITLLLTICLTSYAVVSTYIKYEKEAAEFVTKYDVDAQIRMENGFETECKQIINEYENKYNDQIDYFEYKLKGIYVLIETEDALTDDDFATEYSDGKKGMTMAIVGLDDKTYDSYIKRINAKDGDMILYNSITELEGIEERKYIYRKVLKDDKDIKLDIISSKYNEIEDKHEYKIIDNELLNQKIKTTDVLIEGFKEFKTKYYAPIIFTNMKKYDEFEKVFDNIETNKSQGSFKWIFNDGYEGAIKLRTKNVIRFSNFVQEISQKNEYNIDIEYYTLENSEKIIYIEIVELILRLLIIAIIIIGIVSVSNIINASLCERKEDFEILYRLGTTRKEIKLILIYECLYFCIKSIFISAIISVPIIYGIVKYMENIVVVNKLLVPYTDIALFVILVVLISLGVTLGSIKSIKNK